LGFTYTELTNMIQANSTYR